jgi:hypothetical protein
MVYGSQTINGPRKFSITAWQHKGHFIYLIINLKWDQKAMPNCRYKAGSEIDWTRVVLLPAVPAIEMEFGMW